MLRRLESRWELAFFGLTPADKEQLILEPIFLLMYYCGFTYTEAYNIPVVYKRWWIERVNREITKGNSGEAPQGSRAQHHNAGDVPAILGKHRTAAPSRMQRFT